MKKKILIIALLSVAVIAVVVTVCLIVFKEDEVLAPDYAPPAVEENAEKLEGESGDKLETSEGGGAVSISYWKEATIDLSEKKVALRVDNPGRSYNDMLIQVIVKGEVVAQSGTLKPGYRVSTLDLLDGAAGKLAAGGYSVDTKLVFYFYDPETGEKALVNSEIPITVVVQE